eukprot:scaffold22003_cov18-Tisochrysis_lutea.AAC.1
MLTGRQATTLVLPIKQATTLIAIEANLAGLKADQLSGSPWRECEIQVSPGGLENKRANGGQKRKTFAPSENRTRVSSVAGTYSTTRPMALFRMLLF